MTTNQNRDDIEDDTRHVIIDIDALIRDQDANQNQINQYITNNQSNAKRFKQMKHFCIAMLFVLSLLFGCYQINQTQINGKVRNLLFGCYNFPAARWHRNKGKVKQRNDEFHSASHGHNFDTILIFLSRGEESGIDEKTVRITDFNGLPSTDIQQLHLDQYDKVGFCYGSFIDRPKVMALLREIREEAKEGLDKFNAIVESKKKMLAAYVLDYIQG